MFEDITIYLTKITHRKWGFYANIFLENNLHLGEFHIIWFPFIFIKISNSDPVLSINVF